MNEGTTSATGKVSIFMAGDAMFSLIDARNQVSLESLQARDNLVVRVQPDLARQAGTAPLIESAPVPIRLESDADSFWSALVEMTSIPGGELATGMLVLDGPYMSTLPADAITLLKHVARQGRSPELYLYLDGVHVAHTNQHTVVFDELATALQSVLHDADGAGLHPRVLACARCAAARGYEGEPFDDTNTKSPVAIPEVDFVNLNDIIGMFSRSAAILSSNCIVATHEAGDPGAIPSLNVIVASPPHGKELAFGGISFAVAAAMNHEIPTNLVFVEDGTFLLASRHEIPEGGFAGDLQDLLNSTAGEDNLRYFYHAPSMEARGCTLTPALDHFSALSDQELASIVLGEASVARITRSIMF
jgi:tRNA 2-thiouridine synthesizing protein C